LESFWNISFGLQTRKTHNNLLLNACRNSIAGIEFKSFWVLFQMVFGARIFIKLFFNKPKDKNCANSGPANEEVKIPLLVIVTQNCVKNVQNYLQREMLHCFAEDGLRFFRSRIPAWSLNVCYTLVRIYVSKEASWEMS
jgi:hypothetical protein